MRWHSGESSDEVVADREPDQERELRSDLELEEEEQRERGVPADAAHSAARSLAAQSDHWVDCQRFAGGDEAGECCDQNE